MKKLKLWINKLTYKLSSRIADIANTLWQSKGKLAAGIALTAALNANAQNPLDDVSDSTPVKSVIAPEHYGNLTGADGDVSQEEWYATTDLGYIHKFSGRSETPVSIDTGISGLSGIAYKGDGQFALSAGNDIYEGALDNSWATEDIISLATSDITDIDFALDSYFIATESDGIRKVVDGGSELVEDLGCDSFDLIEFKPNTYDNNMSQRQGESYINVDSSGNPFGMSKFADLHNATTIAGIAHYGGNNAGMAVVQAPGIQHHDPQQYQQNMQPVPEPGTLAMLGLAGLGLLGKTYQKRESGLLVPQNIKG